MIFKKKAGVSLQVFEKIFTEGEKIAGSKPNNKEKAFVSKLLSMITFPYKDTKKQEYERRDGAVKVTMSLPSKWGTIPFGIYPRLIRIFIENEVRRTKSPIIYIGNTLNQFFKLINVQIGGKSVKFFKKQFIAYCNTAISFDTSNGKVNLAVKNFIPVSGMVTFWDDTDPNNESMFDGYIEITNEYYKFIMKNSMPIDLRIVTQLKEHTLALDIFLWLNGRFYNLEDPVNISKKDLKDQFGCDYSRTVDFWRNFKIAAELTKAAFQKANMKITDTGLTLYPSETSVEKKALTL
jgi:hypothetical protein